ncbi:autotransporter outer membrane beta-barrel domain-containing protein [Paroceanicella profunda]|uniref:Autotransporter outer membrane beta-barrel domain-containing protein n=1 Tax=Paroceanicella profunda TaxID=2579971 RepID=A0A5B8FU66_9RHOB|nr:autotransporter outer membrane beta-barrel domain-containing protein [Paroceanicella profunda]QDL91925.1 autotransporter outer membrane beta-barrel domain-containing protein [Paroceanicella profunda]
MRDLCRWLTVPAFLLGTDPARAAELEDLVSFSVERQASGALAAMGIGVVPSETASTLVLNTGTGSDARPDFASAQLGGGFTVSDSFPLYLEGYLGYTRFNPSYLVVSDADRAYVRPKWTSISGTAGIGWDFALNENLVLRPMVNFALGQVVSDTAVLAAFIADHIGAEDARFLRDGGLTAGGLGGSMMLEYNKAWDEDYEADLSLRYSRIHLKPIAGDRGVVGEARAETLALWSRMRVPTGLTLFGRSVRGVGEFSAAWLPGDQGEILRTDWLVQVGAGVEFNLSETWVPLAREVRLVARYTRGDVLQGFGIGLAASF